jgi:MFS family permease
MFSSLGIRNYRLFFFGQLISMSGTWMQTVALGWLVLQLSGDGIAVGVNFALQFLPMLAFGMWGGVIADRFDKRRILTSTQSILMGFALAFFALTFFGAAELWMVFVLTFLLGCVTVVDMPTRQAFVTEMVGRDAVTNAVSLNSAVFNGARIFGPALAGVMIESVGLTWTFLANAITYFGTIGAYALMRRSELQPATPAPREKGQVRAGLRYARERPELLYTLVMVTVVSGIGLNFTVVLPLMARFEFSSGANIFGLLTSIMALGSLSGALFSAARKRPTRRLLIGSAAAFGMLELVASVAPTLWLFALLLLPIGVASILFIATANSTLQLNSSPVMRGRVMALYALVFLGSAPLGAPVVGWVSEALGARAGLALGGLASLGTAVVAAAMIRREQLAGIYRSLSSAPANRHTAEAPEEGVAPPVTRLFGAPKRVARRVVQRSRDHVA